MNDNEKNATEVYALGMLTILRRMKRLRESGMGEMEKECETIVPELKNMIMEHMTTESIANVAAMSLAKDLSMTLREIMLESLALTGRINANEIIQIGEAWCSRKLGREIKV